MANLVSIETRKIGDFRWRLLRDFHYNEYKVPAGFVTDGVTSPRWLWWFEPPCGKCFEAAILHDYLIRYHVVSKEIADFEFYNYLIKETGTSKFKAKLMYLAVKYFSNSRFGKANK